MGKLWIVLAFVMLTATVFSKPPPIGSTTGNSSALSRVASAISDLCLGLTQLLPVASMLMIVLAGVIYAAGQMMGAETRARANVWATAALTGALIGLLIFAIAPSVLTTIYGQGNVQC